jgi:hypothetical protein
MEIFLAQTGLQIWSGKGDNTRVEGTDRWCVSVKKQSKENEEKG